MFCTNCGDALEEGAVFCTKCGQRVIQETVTEAAEQAKEAVTEVSTEAAEQAKEAVTEVSTEAAEQAKEAVTEVVEAAEQAKATEATAPVQAAASQSTFAVQPENNRAQEPVMEVAAKQPKQFKMPSKKVWIIGAVAAALVVVLAVVLVNFQSLANATRKLAMSPQEYYSYIEKKQLEEMTSDFFVNYDKSLEMYGDASGQSLEYALDVELGELVCEAISSSLGVEDVSGLSKIGMDFKVATNEENYSGGIVARLGDRSLISLNALAQMEKGMIYLQLPELSNKFIGVDISAEMSELEDAFAEYGNVLELYPEGEVLEDMIHRYMTIVIDSFEDVKEVKDVVTVGDYEEKCTTLCATMTEPEMYTMLETILKEAKDDKALQDMLVGFVAYAEVTDEQEFRNSFTESIDTYLNNIDIYKAQADSNNYFSMSIMVNKKGEVIGRKFEVNKQELLISYMMPQEKDAFGYELKVGSVSSLVIIEGEGTKTSSEMSGEFLIRMDSMDIGQFDIATLVIESMDMKKWDQGLLDITCRIKPDAELYSELGVGAAGVLLAGYELIYEAHMEVGKEEAALSLVNGSELIIKLMTVAKSGQYEGIEVPTDSILYETDEDLLEWMQTMDFDKFMENIAQSGMPAELVESIESYVNELSALLSYDEL